MPALEFFFFTFEDEIAEGASALLSVRLLELDGFERQTEELERLVRVVRDVALEDAERSLLGPGLSAVLSLAPEALPLKNHKLH